jgi:hypothetical protein
VTVSEELVFTVDGGSAAAAAPISLAEAGLREREHLQRWVLANPEILGSDVLIITSEFDRWESRGGAERDRLDILGLSTDGRLVVAELKRDTAPDTVEMQAIKYAAMASRFDSDRLADAYVHFARAHQHETLTTDEAVDRLAAHTELGLNDEVLRTPRIVLVASQFPASVTATAVWLNEMGIDITLTRLQAYRTMTGETLITVSQHYPPPDVEDFLVAPTRAARRARTPELPDKPWTLDDLVRLSSEVDSPTIRATLDLCSERPDTWIPAEAITSVTGRSPAQHRGDFGGFAITLRRRFDRSNPPYEVEWAVGGLHQQHYRVSAEIADLWKRAREQSGDTSPIPTASISHAVHLED